MVGAELQILFGWHLDGSPWTTQKSLLGSVTVGPSGLISILQTRLGLTSKRVSQSQRILQYRKRLAELNTADAWHHDSFDIAPWASAIEILKLRDELIGAGWRPSHGVTGTLTRTLTTRLGVIRSAELLDIPLPAGPSDHLAELCTELTAMAEANLGLESITLADNRVLLPALWRSVFDELERLGARITASPQPFPRPIASTVVVSSDGHSSAEAAARWIGTRARRLAAEGDETSTLGIVVTADTSLLDRELGRRGLPQLGFAHSSPYRAYEQLVPQVMNLAFAPANPARLADFLAVPLSPVPRRAARRLLEALVDQPGVGGDAWQKAILDIRELDIPEAQETAGNVDRFFSTDLADRVSGLTRTQITTRCSWVIARLARLVKRHPELAAAIAQATELASIADSLEMVSHRDLQQILDSVVANGSPSNGVTGSVEQAASWIRVTDPSQLPDSVDDVLWWGFDAPGISSPHVWDESERRMIDEDIADSGGLPDSGALNQLRADADQRLLSCTKDRLLLFREESAGWPVQPSHSLEEVLATSRKEDDQSPGTVDVSELVTSEGMWKLAGEEKLLVEVLETPGTVARRSSYNGDLLYKIERISYSQLDTLIGCPRFWSLRYAAGIKVAPGHELLEGDRTIGVLAHKLVEVLFEHGPRTLGYVPDAASVETFFDRLVPHLAAELLLPGQSARHQRARTTVCSNVFRLFQILRDRDVRIVAIEHPISREFELEVGAPLVSLNGSIDVLGELPDGRQVVIDLKWTTSDKIYRERIEAGEALQLATYAWALNAEAVAGYFMLRQGVLLTDSDELSDKLTSTRSLDQVWDVGVHTARLRLARIRSGFVECYSEWQQSMSQQALDRGESQSRADDALMMRIRGGGEMYSRPACSYGGLGSLCGQLEEQR